ncbi:MAG: dCTP deaminase [Candidatus ainarchaeum sp.]|nr:dCTP deaminase [Candidatus ainarchaeum sp.]
MILSNKDIKERMRKGEIKIRPFREEQLGSATVDLTLSDEWEFFKKKLIGTRVDLEKVPFQEAVEKVRADYAMLAPGEIVLAKTLEKITLPAHIMGKLEGRSRYARMGLSIHITSAIVQPGSSNHQVLEILNSAPFTVILHKGMRLSQIVFYELKTPSSKPYAKFGKIARRQ